VKAKKGDKILSNIKLVPDPGYLTIFTVERVAELEGKEYAFTEPFTLERRYKKTPDGNKEYLAPINAAFLEGEYELMSDVLARINDRKEIQ
jgi:hypothetical protein